jgi:hypothetical protein
MEGHRHENLHRSFPPGFTTITADMRRSVIVLVVPSFRPAEERHPLKRILTSSILLVFLAFGAASASAEPVQQFAVQLKDIKPSGQYTVVFRSNSFDTTGDPPPALTRNEVRFPKGIQIRKPFLAAGRRCQQQKLKDLLIENQTPAFQYAAMLKSLPNTLKKLRKDLTPAQAKLIETCSRAYIGSGKVSVDVRPLFPENIPALFYLFLTKPTEKGAIGAFAVMALTDQRSAFVRNNSLIAGQKPLFTVNLFNDPSPDGLYGYRIKLPPSNIGLIKFSVAELEVVSPGITDVKRTCATKRKGRCTKFRTTSTFWADPPECPASGQLTFRAEYEYETGLVTDKTIPVPCPRFGR